MRRSLFGAALERRTAPGDGGVGWSDPSAIPPNSSFSRQLAGVVVNEHTALQLISVMACIRLVSGAVGQLPFQAFSRGSAGREPVKAPPIVSSPFADVDLAEGLEMGVVSMMLRGNAYYQVVARDFAGYPTLLDPLAPQDVVVRRIGGVTKYWIKHQPVDSHDVVHLRWMTLPGGIVGLSPIEYAAQGLGITLAAEEYGARFFAQGASVAGVLQSDQALTKDQIRRVAQDFSKHHGGLSQAHLPLVLDGGLKWAATSLPPDQAQFLATREFQRGEIAMLYGVPPHMIGDTDKTTSWGKGIEDQKIDFATFTLQRYTSRFEAAWNAMTRPGIETRFDFDSMLRANTTDRYNAYMMARTVGFLSNDEIRAKENMPPTGLAAMADYTQPLNSSPKPIPAGGDGAL